MTKSVLWSSLLAVALASSTLYPCNPDRDGQVMILLDATSWGDHLSFMLKMTKQQLPDIFAAYEKNNYTLEIGVASFGKRSGTCYKDILDVTSDQDSIYKALSSAPQYDVINGDDQAPRNTWNAITHTVASYKFRMDDDTRRVVMVLSDDIGHLDGHNTDDPYTFPVAPQEHPSPATVSEWLMATRTGLVYAIQASSEAAMVPKLDLVTNELVKLGHAKDRRYSVNADESVWHAVDNHLSIMLSREHKTTTTTYKPAPGFKFDPVGDTQVWFLLDSTTSHSQGYHIEFGTQMCIHQLEALFNSFEKSSYTLKVGAATFGRISGTCWKPLMDLTDDYTTVRKTMSNPPTYDLNNFGERNTLNAIMYAAESLFEGTARRVIVVISDGAGVFGSEASYGGDVPPKCPQKQPSPQHFKETIEYNRVGLLFTLISNPRTPPGTQQQQLVETFLQPARLTDIFVNTDWSMESWDTVNYHLTRMIGKEWVATTTTQAPMERIRECVAKIDCTA